jgi:hypothetical protein
VNRRDRRTPLHLDRALRALAMAAPLALAARYSSRAQCVPASVAGAAVLRAHKIKARIVRCALLAIGESPTASTTYTCAVGHSLESASAAIKKIAGDDAPTLADLSPADFPARDSLHVVIEASRGCQRALIDLTAGQVMDATDGQLRVPEVVVWHGDGWPRVALPDGGRLVYGPPPEQREAAAPWRACRVPGLVDDVNDLMQLALAVDLDPKKFRDLTAAFAAQFGLTERLRAHGVVLTGGR